MPNTTPHKPSSKRSSPDQEQAYPQPKRRQVTSSYWDNLSTVWLTQGALQEFDRRTSVQPQPEENPDSRPATRLSTRRQRESRGVIKYADEFIRECTPQRLREIRHFARRGGPDLRDIAHCQVPHLSKMGLLKSQMNGYKSMPTASRIQKRRAKSPALSLSTASQSTSSSKRTKSTVDSSTSGSAKTTSTTAYSRNFQQHLVDSGVYPDGYMYPDGEFPGLPDNWDELNDRLARERRSLSPTAFSMDDFRKFKQTDTRVPKEVDVIASVIPVIDGNGGSPGCLGRDYLFNNLSPLTDGSLVIPKPDHFYGARPEQLDLKVRDELSTSIIPSKQDDLPIVPNFFLEAKGPDGIPIVGTRQACYDGAVGARGIQALQSYKLDKPVYDNKSYTITATYQTGTLKLYATHITPPKDGDGRPEYIMSSLGSYSMTNNLRTFREGAAAYRNLRDWAKEQRDSFIDAANERHKVAQAELSLKGCPKPQDCEQSGNTAPAEDTTKQPSCEHAIPSVEVPEENPVKSVEIEEHRAHIDDMKVQPLPIEV
ncbi:hypothetical protein TMEN_3561 [Trichophyton mentagrophytes]|uniref:Uncharacterized protein n=1 Tax=Trichophyton interdigitale (strain MR816) TaxID=1215338 RepID=A0A059IZS6_TRIIM|nr:hypothetical protein H101_03649 [Trichophyton interdigitale H6]KDB20722.1 hypothetical protein H109_07333 [Trichophyton interdigitale MR816]GBF61093.1 hypothetical protein TMEN_3561 [Trichophyton mentagrophytes]